MIPTLNDRTEPEHSNKETMSNDESKSVLSGTSPIQVKFIGWLVVVCAGGFGGWIWWAASMSTKLDVVLTNQAVQMAAIKSVAEDVSRLKEWRIQIDTVGSPALVRRAEILERELGDLMKQFELHKALTMPQKSNQHQQP